MAPGIVLPAQQDGAAAAEAKAATATADSVQDGKTVGEPSYLAGPELVPNDTIALECLRKSFKKNADQLAIASLFQPADYLAAIFEEGPAPMPLKPGANYLRWNFAQVEHAGQLLAAGLAARGVHEGMTLACFAKGCLEFYVILYAALILRCRFSPINPAVTAQPNESTSMLQVTSANVVFSMDDEAIDRIEATIPEVMHDMFLKVAVHGPSPKQAEQGWQAFETVVTSALPIAAALKSLEAFEEIPIDADDDVYILFTSGTSSLPKACPLTNRNLCSMATNYANGPSGGNGAVICNHLPIYHIAGGISMGWNPITSGAAVVHPSANFSASSTLEAMRREGVTFMVLVPSMLGLIADDPSLPPKGQVSIKSVSLGASTILYTDVERCYQLLGAKGVVTSYGMTEGLNMTRSYLPREPNHAALNGIQRIVAGARLKICKPNSREIVPRGEAGEVHQGGATAIRGYIGTKTNAFYDDENGTWCMTGDQAIMHPDGGVQITGRYKDIIIRGGVNVSPSAIEGVIAKILKIEAHVVGMPDSIAGEVPVAIVRKADIGKNSAAQLRNPIVKELGPKFALEKFITLEDLGLEEFPTTSTGKIRKVDLQAAVKQYAISKQNDAEAGAGDQSGNSLERLIQIWSDVAGLDLEELSGASSVQELADSLMLSRFANTVKNSFARAFTLDDLTKFPTLGEQAELLDSRLEPESANSDLEHGRPGPPAAEDMAHCGDSEDLALKTRQVVEKVLNPMGFEWEDVQDVCTPTQWLQSWVKSRETSDKFRAAYITTEADVTTLAAAFSETLSRNDSLRAISIPFGDGTDIQAILRHTDKWLAKVITVRDEPVEKISDLEKLLPGDYKLNKGLVQVHIVHCKETNTAGAVLMTLHTTFDAFSLDTMRKDMTTILNNQKPQQHVPYKLWTDNLYNLRESKKAKTAIAYNVERLRGLASLRAALWPPQRTAVWQRGGDRGLHITPEGAVTTPDDPNQRTLIDGAASMGSTGLRREHALEDITILTATHRIPPPVVVKAALTILETRLTGQSTALFSQTFAMRDNWPFIDNWMSTRLPSPLEVTGPCLSRIAEVIPVDREMTVMDWLQKLKAEQEVLVTHAHAPYREVFDQLNRGTAAPSDGGFASASPVAQSPLESANGSANGNGHAAAANGIDEVISEEGGAAASANGEAKRPNGHMRQRSSSTTVRRSDSSAIPASPTAATTPTFNRIRGYTVSKSSRPRPVMRPSIDTVVPFVRDGDVMESIRKRINFQWLPIFGNDKKVKPQIRVASSSHFNEVGLAVKSGMLADHKTVWVKMEWDDGNISRAEAKDWIEEMIALIELMGHESTWSKPVGELYSVHAAME